MFLEMFKQRCFFFKSSSLIILSIENSAILQWFIGGENLRGKMSLMTMSFLNIKCYVNLYLYTLFNDHLPCNAKSIFRHDVALFFPMSIAGL